MGPAGPGNRPLGQRAGAPWPARVKTAAAKPSRQHGTSTKRSKNITLPHLRWLLGLADVAKQLTAVGLGADGKGVMFGVGGGDSVMPGSDNCGLANSDTANTAYHVPSSAGFSQSRGEIFKPSVYGLVKPPVSTRLVNPVECLQPVQIPSLKSGIKERVSDTVVSKLAYTHWGLPYEHTHQRKIGFYDLDYDQ